MDTEVDYYEVLGVPINADRAEIKAAWSDLVQKYHPDMGNGADPKKFMQVQKAFEVLGDTDQRIKYDRARDAANPPASEQVEEDYVPGWGQPTDESKAAAAPTNMDAPPRTREWIPPHMRAQEPEPEPAAEPRATSAKQASTATTPPEPRPRPVKSWRTVAQPGLKPKLVRDWKTLWLAPLIIFAASLITGLLAVNTAGEGTVGTLTPVLVITTICVGLVATVIDWSRIQGGRDSILGVGIATVLGLILIILGFSDGNLWLAGTGLLTGGWVGYLGVSLQYKYIRTRQMPPKQLRKYVAFGKPGKFAGETILQLIEQELANSLSELFRIPSARLFHGVSVPASPEQEAAGEVFVTKYGAKVVPGGYIGQAVTAGNRVALLSSVTWPAGTYTLDQYGAVMIDGQHTQFDLEPFMQDLRLWQAKLKSEASVRLFIVVHSDGPVTFNLPDEHPVEMVSAHDVNDTVGTWLVEQQDVLNRHVNSTIAEHLAAA